MRTAPFVFLSLCLLLASPAAFADEPSCAVERFVGVTPEDAEAVSEIVCAEIAEHAPYGARHRIRIARLGGKVVLTLVSDHPRGDGPVIEKQLVLSGLEEVPVAAPRLVEATGDAKPVAETATVTSVVAEEARAPKKRASEVHGWLGMVAVAAPGGGSGAGAHLGLSAGSERWSFVGDLRLAGQAFNDPAAVAVTVFSLGLLEPEPESELSYVSLSAGVRHHFFATDTSPLLGAGVALDYLGRDRADGGDAEATGVAGYGELGLDLMRTHAIGGAIAFRVDAPAFMLEGSARPVGSWSASTAPTYARTRTWLPVIGATFSLRF